MRGKKLVYRQAGFLSRWFVACVPGLALQTRSKRRPTSASAPDPGVFPTLRTYSTEFGDRRLVTIAVVVHVTHSCFRLCA